MPIQKIVTPVFRVAFAHVFKPRAGDGGKLQYELQMVFPKTTDIKALKDLAAAAVKERWGEKLPQKPFKHPFRDGAEKAQYEGFGPNTVFIRASSQQKPPIFSRENQEIITPEEFYSGCYAQAVVNCYTYERPEKNGVSFGLLGLRKHGDGQPFVAKATAEDFGDPMPEGSGPAAPAVSANDPLWS